MPSVPNTWTAMGVVLALAAGVALPAAAAEMTQEEMIAKGRELAFDRGTGNCLACHMMEDGELPGNIGPPLIAMKQRYPDKARLREQIANPRKLNPHTVMPPFGDHQIYTEEELDLVTEYVHSL